MNRVILIFVFLISVTTVFAQSEFSVDLYDSQRSRIVPVAVYQPRKVSAKTQVVILNHGYDGNKNSKSNQTYSYLSHFLSQKGYFVISIQHELANDPLLEMTGDFMQTRMPNWERGVENILFSIKEFKKLKPTLDWNELTVIGHSNGGDMTMLFASKYPGMLVKAISLDHRRMVMPRCSRLRIYTLRGCDYEADKRVIPTAEEQQEFNITVVKLDGIRHTDMDDKGSVEQHDRILRYINEFLKD